MFSQEIFPEPSGYPDMYTQDSAFQATPFIQGPYSNHVSHQPFMPPEMVWDNVSPRNDFMPVTQSFPLNDTIIDQNSHLGPIWPHQPIVNDFDVELDTHVEFAHNGFNLRDAGFHNSQAAPVSYFEQTDLSQSFGPHYLSSPDTILEEAGHTAVSECSSISSGDSPRAEPTTELQCQYCEKAKFFPRPCDLRKHIKNRHTIMPCPGRLCDKTFAGHIVAKRHFHSAHKEYSQAPSLFCPYSECNQSRDSGGDGFRRQDVLHRHLKSVHNKSSVSRSPVSAQQVSSRTSGHKR